MMKLLTISKSRIAFTLAEVLITLTIVGILASITIPSVIQDFQKQSILSQLKETYSILNNALNRSKIKYGTDINTWYIADTSESDAAEYFATKYLIPNLNVREPVCGRDTSQKCVHKIRSLNDSEDYFISGASWTYSFQLANSSIVRVSAFNQTGNSVSDLRIFITFDVNGKDGPNVLGKDAFEVELGTSDKNKFTPYGIENNRSALMDANLVSCNKDTGSGKRCFALIMKDNWKFADDYPW